MTLCSRDCRATPKKGVCSPRWETNKDGIGKLGLCQDQGLSFPVTFTQGAQASEGRSVSFNMTLHARLVETALVSNPLVCECPLSQTK